MNYDPAIHPLSMRLKSLMGKLEFFFTKLNYPNDELIVVNYHSTPDKFLSNFEEQVIFFKQNFQIIDPNELNTYYDGGYAGKNKPLLLFTFDDGLKNNLGALEILEKHNLKAYLFIVPAFIDEPRASQKDYYIKHIRPFINPLIDAEPKDFEAISWELLKTLVDKGHRIGCHTYTHGLVASASTQENSLKEIVESKAYIEEKIKSQLNSFCSINNTLISVGSKEKKLINKTYRFHFTTLPGLNSKDKDALFIKRRNVESFWLKGAVLYSIGRLDLPRWKEKLLAFVKM